MKRGRPSKLTPERLEKILESLREGNYRDTAAEGAGIAYNTFREWEKKGGVEEKGKFHDFYESVKRAEAEGEQLHIRRINKAGEEGAWQADAWMLERKDPKKWGRKDATKLELSGEVKTINAEQFQQLQEAIVKSLDPTARAKLSERLLKMAETAEADLN
jgi:PHD/YefM family antitoxin component YafN of YafNO toxin-antitoxin module